MSIPNLSGLSNAHKGLSIDMQQICDHSLKQIAYKQPIGGPATRQPASSAIDLSDLAPDLLELVVSFLSNNPCELEWKNFCMAEKRLAEWCFSEAFWHKLCERQGWTRPDRTTGYHAMPDPPTKTQWKDQFFKWCKLRFGPLSKKEVMQFHPLANASAGRDVFRQNETGMLMLEHVVEKFLDKTNRTGVLDETKTYDDVVATYGPMNTWDVSRVTNMSFLFSNKREFNADISQWDTSNVTNMSFMFQGATAFNADIGGWNVSNVHSFFRMFEYASAFNQDLKDWNVSKVDSFTNMFANARAFNQNLSDWHQLDESRVVKEEASKNGMFFNSGLSENNWPSWLRK